MFCGSQIYKILDYIMKWWRLILFSELADEQWVSFLTLSNKTRHTLLALLIRWAHQWINRRHFHTPDTAGFVPFLLLAVPFLSPFPPHIFSLHHVKKVNIHFPPLTLVVPCFLLKMVSLYVSFPTVICNSPSPGWFCPVSSLQHLTYLDPSFIVSPPSFSEYRLASFPFPTDFSLNEVPGFTLVLLSSHIKVRILQSLFPPRCPYNLIFLCDFK